MNARAWLGVVLAIGLAGCAPLGSKQMERVAKDWSLSIRANQVVPVYPLTEDLVPGDVFLVQRSVSEQQAEFKSKGFLALDDHRYRAPELNYTLMYFDGYWKDDFGATPHPRPARRANATTIPTQPVDARTATDLTEIPAPRAAFPTYSFQANRGEGLSLGVPVHGVPVALNFLGADQAVGTVTLLDSHTYAADTYELDAKVRDWAKLPNVKDSLRDAVKMRKTGSVFIRVVSRIYLIGGVAVSLQRSDSAGGNATVGSPPAKVSPVNANGDVNANYEELLKNLGTQVNSPFAVGGTVQFTQASQLGVSLNETFDHPLVVGYLGFDIAVDENGNLGPRVPTFQVLAGNAPAPAPLVGVYTPDEKKNLDRHAMFTSLRKKGNNDKVLSIIEKVGQSINDPRLQADGVKAAALRKVDPPPADVDAQVNAIADAFENDWDLFVALSDHGGGNYKIFGRAFEKANAH